MKTIEESVVIAMDGSDIELFPYLPYILQDIWELGSYPEVIIKLIEKHFKNYNNLEVLDLGCGKGAVSVVVAHKFNCKCYGIDAIPEFISFAKEKAAEFNVEQLCKFEVGDIRERIIELKEYDIIILGAIGPVLGNYFTTLSTLSKQIKHSGIIIIDDGYIEDDSDFTHPLILKKNEMMQQIDRAGMKLVENHILAREIIKDSDDYIFDKLNKRCNELIEKYPDKQKLFLDYIEKQKLENDVLENKVIATTMVIKNKN